MRKFASFLTVVAAAAAPFRHRGRDRDYWSVEDPDELYGPLSAEPFAALGVACTRTAGRLTRATATKESFEDAEACLDALLARAKLGPEYFDVVPLLEVRVLQYQAMDVTLDGFADVIDETQLSLELYFYARELNRADHMLLGLAPPGVGLLPPGEEDVFAGRA